MKKPSIEKCSFLFRAPAQVELLEAPGDVGVDNDVAADGVERPDHAAHVLEGERAAACPRRRRRRWSDGHSGGGDGGGRSGVGPVKRRGCRLLLLLLLLLLLTLLLEVLLSLKEQLLLLLLLMWLLLLLLLIVVRGIVISKVAKVVAHRVRGPARVLPPCCLGVVAAVDPAGRYRRRAVGEGRVALQG